MEEEKLTFQVSKTNSNHTELKTPEEIKEETHATLHKEIKEDMRSIAIALHSLTKLMESAKFSFNSVNEQSKCENHLGKIKNISRKLRNKYSNEI